MGLYLFFFASFYLKHNNNFDYFQDVPIEWQSIAQFCFPIPYTPMNSNSTNCHPRDPSMIADRIANPSSVGHKNTLRSLQFFVANKRTFFISDYQNSLKKTINIFGSRKNIKKSINH